MHSLIMPSISKTLFTLCLAIAIAYGSHGQDLTFTRPEVLLPAARTNQAMDITNFNGIYFVTWREADARGSVRYSCLGKEYDTARQPGIVTIPGAETNAAPVLRVLDKRIYLFWISKTGQLKYIINNTDNSFDTTAVYEVNFAKPLLLTQGITATPVNGKIIIASHGQGKYELLAGILTPAAGGQFSEAEPIAFTGQSSPNYPFVVTVAPKLVRFCWSGKDHSVTMGDYNIETKTWTNVQSLPGAKTSNAPAIYQVWNADRLFYIWPAYKGNQLMYLSATYRQPSAAGRPLPPSFSTALPVSICKVDENNFLLAYTGADQQIYLSKFSNYDPATWMQQILAPLKSAKTLQDCIAGRA